MSQTAGEKIRVILKLKKITITKLASELGQSKQNFSGKLTRDNFSEEDLREIASALGCQLNITFTLIDTGETI